MFVLIGTRENLWNTVPPKMAQRVFSGMLNESLTILSVRYSQVNSIIRSFQNEHNIVDILLFSYIIFSRNNT